MKAHILTVVILDHNGLGAEGVVEELQATNFANDCISPKVGRIETFDLGPWVDPHPLNSSDTDQVAWLRENASTTRARAKEMCVSYVAGGPTDECLRCGWNHREVRERKAVEEIRTLLEINERAAVGLGYHDGINRRREALGDLRFLLARLDRLEKSR